MRAAALVLVLVGAAALGQVIGQPCINGANCKVKNLIVTGAPNLSNVVLATTGPVALYVNDAGNDASACTSATLPCLTISGALAKIPSEVRHPVTVDVAAGNYAGFALTDRTFNPFDAGAGAYISIRGTVGFFAPATGGADGGVTSVTTDAVGFHVVSDSNNAFTVNDLSTRFLSLVSGTGAGQALPIISNTATAVTVSGTFSPAPVAGTGYAITTPATNITTTVNMPATVGVVAGLPRLMYFSNLGPARNSSNASGSGTVSVSDVTLSNSSQTWVGGYNVSGLALTRVRGSTTGITLSSFGGYGNTLFNACALKTTVAQAILTTANLTTSAGVPTAHGITLANSYVSSGATLVLSSNANHGILTSEVEAVSTTAGLTVGGPSHLTITGSRIRCTSTGIGISMPSSSTSGFAPGRHVQMTGTNIIDSCATGMSLAGKTAVASIVGGSMTFLSNTTAVSATGGGQVSFVTAVPTFTTNTTDLSVDGTTSTRAAFVALTPNLLSSAYGTAVFLQP